MQAAPSDFRSSCYLLLIAAAVGIAGAKIAGAENVFEPSRYAAPGEKGRAWPKERPEPSLMFSSNDRSRWATIRALVENGTYVVGHRENHTDDVDYRDTGIIFEDGYQSLDKVMNPATGDFYSSKPPLMPTVLAGEYWILNRAFGWSIVRDEWLVMGFILVTVNVVPFAVYLLLLSRLVEEHGASDFGKLLAMVAAGFGTFLTTFAGTLNNHGPAAYCVLFAVYPLLRTGGATLGGVAVSGFFAGLATALDLPAAAFLAGLLVPTLWVRPRAGLVFAGAAAVPLVALIACNIAALGTVVPAYGEFGGPWYNYAGSHWAKLGTPAATGIDFAKEPKPIYAFHLLFGHHGWFALTPVWLVALVGLAALAWASGPEVRSVMSRTAGANWNLRLLGAMTVCVSIVVMAFYIRQTNNYGGSTSGPRWLFWLTPLWLLALVRGGDAVSKSPLARGVAAVLLAMSAFGAFYPATNPWRSPWLMHWLEYHGWVRY